MAKVFKQAAQAAAHRQTDEEERENTALMEHIGRILTINSYH